MLKKTIIPTAFLAISLSGCNDFKAPDSWTIRADGRLRASQRNEDFSTAEWIEKINKEEGKSFGICLSPAGAESVTNELKSCKIELASCKAGK